MHRAPLLLLLLTLCTLADSASGAMTKAFVACTDFSTGSLGAVSLATRAVSPDLESINADATLRYYGGLLYVVNRFGQDNVQVVDPASGHTLRQFSCGNGSNPYDIAFVSATHAYVTRYERSDLLIVNPATGASLGVISLAAFADADGIPEMDRMVRVDRWLFVSLQRLNRNASFQPTDSSLVAVIDTEADTVLDVNPLLPGKQAILLAAKNPVTTFAFDRASSRLLLGCVGRYGVLDGGIEWIDPVNFTSLGLAVTESALGGDVGGVMWNDAAHSYALISDAAFNSALVSWNANTGMKLATVYAPGGFSLSDAALDDRGELWVCNSGYSSPGLRVFRAGADTLLAGPLDTGLPPYVLTFDAASEQVLDAGPAAPAAALALTAWPNPARGATRLSLALPAAVQVTLEVFDVSGRRVAVVADGPEPAGRREFEWDLKSAAGARVEAGVYVLRARAGSASTSKRIAVVR